MKKTLLLFTIVTFAACTKKHTSAPVTSGIISTIAGNGTWGYSGDGRQSDSAALGHPTGIAIDATGNIYIADYTNNRIRKVSTSGIITTIAGYGYGAAVAPLHYSGGGYAGDGGQADSAELYSPQSIAIDGSGNVYIADQQNNRIRKVNSSGVITTIAGNGVMGYSGDGGQATLAELNYPSGIAVDASGNVFIADYSNHRIRKVSSAGIISTFAGNGYISGGYGGYSGDGGLATAAELNYPQGVAVDDNGNVFIADHYNMRIRKVNTTGIITTIAGNGTQGYSGDGEPATSAQLAYPSGIAIDGIGNVYIVDLYNNVIRKVNTVGIISTIAGNGFGAGMPGGYTVSDIGDGGSATSAELWAPFGVAVDGSGNVFVADQKNNRIRKVNN